ncbi:hypothetical protein ACIBKY_09925 [Nonomuraea sp. NPDC050394]|uniref:hypothetical protein n=1 Tax=Nonomuraea sp. NPDC050394 TaxID=3364363 RepID=UPI00378D9CEB
MEVRFAEDAQKEPDRWIGVRYRATGANANWSVVRGFRVTTPDDDRTRVTGTGTPADAGPAAAADGNQPPPGPPRPRPPPVTRWRRLCRGPGRPGRCRRYRAGVGAGQSR